MQEKFLIVVVTVICFVVGGVLFGQPLVFNNLLLLTILGIIAGVINAAMNQQKLSTTSKMSTLTDKLTSHPVLLIINGLVIGLIVGTTIGSYLGSSSIGSIVGGIVGLIISSIWVFRMAS